MTGTGNLRQGSITGYEGEIDQCVLDICSWFYAKAPVLALKEDVAGADAATIGSLESKFGELPVGLRELLQIHDGGILLESFTMMSGKVRSVCVGGGEMGLLLARGGWRWVGSWMDSGEGRGVEKESATREKRVCPGMDGSVWQCA